MAVNTIDDFVSELKTEGWCLFEDVIRADRIDAIREEVVSGNAQAIADYDAWGGSWVQQKGPNGEPGTCLVAYVPSLAACFADERVLGVARAMLDPHVRISQTEFKTCPPNAQEANRRSWHSDFPHDLTDRERAGAVRMPFPNVTMGLTALWILSPFSPDNGGTWIVPRSHLDLRNPRSHLDSRNPPELHDDVPVNESIPGEIQLSGPAGSVVMIDSRVWHSAAGNPSPEPRVAVLTRYSPWWMNLEFGGRNRAIVPRKTYETMPDAVKLLYRHRAEGESDPIRLAHEATPPASGNICWNTKWRSRRQRTILRELWPLTIFPGPALAIASENGKHGSMR